MSGASDAAGIVFGLLDTSDQIGDCRAAVRYRDFTISWSRYCYSGPIIEGKTVGAILTRASRSGGRYCLIQTYGSIIRHGWKPEHWGSPDFMTAMREWADAGDFLVAGRIFDGEDAWYGLDPEFLLVDLERFAELGELPCELPASEQRLLRPRAEQADGEITVLVPTGETVVASPRSSGWSLIEASLRSRMPVLGLPPVVVANTATLEAGDPKRRAAFQRHLQGELAAREIAEDRELQPDQRDFLETVERQTSNARRGVFLWNIEPYTDIETPPDGFTGPLRSLYSVGAGFKPNRILETHGFNADTRVVFFDYSPAALAVRRELVENWDGRAFPHFVRYLFQKFPPPQTFYQLWAGASPQDVAWDDVEQMWRREIQRWGSEQRFREHWEAYRQLHHEYVLCNVLTDPQPLIDTIVPESSALIWFSNAFFTMYSNWYYTLDERRELYERFVQAVAERAPDLLLCGSDNSNFETGSVRAGPYWARYRALDNDHLDAKATSITRTTAYDHGTELSKRE